MLRLLGSVIALLLFVECAAAQAVRLRRLPGESAGEYNLRWVHCESSPHDPNCVWEGSPAQPQPQPQPQAAVWRRVAVMPTETEQKGANWRIVISKGTVFYEELNANGICSIAVTFADPPATIRAKDPAYLGLVVEARAMANFRGGYSGFVTARYWSNLEFPRGLVAWEGDRNPGMTGENDKLVGCQPNEPKKRDSIFTFKLIDNPPEQFEIRTFVGANNLVARYHYLKDR